MNNAIARFGRTCVSMLVGGSLAATSVGPVPADPRAATAELSRLASESAEAREADAVSAASADVARVLASMSAGLSQLATSLGVVAP